MAGRAIDSSRIRPRHAFYAILIRVLFSKLDRNHRGHFEPDRRHCGVRTAATGENVGRHVMEALLGFKIDFWDYATFATLFFITATGLGTAVLILGLPGRIAVARKHPEADAVYLMGWIGFLAVVPWIQALIWAFKPTSVIDIRYFPKDVQHETELMIARLSGKPTPPAAASTATEPPAKG